jgi:hypothetical protein
MHDDRRSLNALYSDNRLKLGVFGANVSNGCAATTAPGRLEMNWPNSRDIVTLADFAGFESSGAGSPLEGLRRRNAEAAATTTPADHECRNLRNWCALCG